jgi:hypothetical protein
MNNDQVPMTKWTEDRAFDLAERTAVFGEEVIRLAKSMKRNSVTSPLINQLVRSATSIGANYVEADEAGSTRLVIGGWSLVIRDRVRLRVRSVAFYG